MTREEMLKRMGLSSDELSELLQKLGALYVSLNERQRAVLNRSLPTHSAAAKTFGASVTAADLQKLLKTEHHAGFASGSVVAVQDQNP